MLGNVREQRQSLKGSSERREHERESKQRKQERRAGSRGRSMRSRSREQGAGAERANSVSEEQAARERAARAGSSGSRSKERGARGAQCARTIGACTMLVAVRSAVEQALHRWHQVRLLSACTADSFPSVVINTIGSTRSVLEEPHPH